MNELGAFTMQNLFLVFISGVCLIALFLVTGYLFPMRMDRIQSIVTNIPGRSFLLGLVNTLFFAALILGFVALGDAFGLQWISIFAILLLTIYLIALIFGLVGMVKMIGIRLSGSTDSNRQVIFGAMVLIFACLTPFIGWFILFPYIGLTGVGAFVISIFKGSSSVLPELE
jgi:hypothetical protein